MFCFVEQHAGSVLTVPWPLSCSTGGVPQGSPRRPSRGASVAGGGAGRGGGDGSEGGADRLQDAQLQQQIVLALRRLREDMRSVMDRLEVVERLAATHVSTSSTAEPACSYEPTVPLALSHLCLVSDRPRVQTGDHACSALPPPQDSR